MNFHPENLFDTNRGENVVWSALKVAFENVPGDAFYRYPIIDPQGFVRYEPDILLMLPGHVPLVLECKGCRLDQIEAISGSVWSMSSSWHRSEEYPITQARSQAVALGQMLGARNAAGIVVLSLVVLPFISADDWSRSALAQAAHTDGIFFAEDLDSASLRDRVLGRLTKSTLDSTRYQRVLEVIGFGARSDPVAEPIPPTKIPSATQPAQNPAPARGKPGVIRLLRYRGHPPTASELRAAAKLMPDTPYTYLVATSALERLRRRDGLGGQHQLRKDLRSEASDPEEMQLLFHNALRHFIGRPVLTRAEERLVLQRAIHVVAQDKQRGDQLLRDVFTWRDVLAELEESGTDLSRAGPGTDLDWSHPALRDVARELQSAYRKERQQAGRGKTSFEDLAGQYLELGYRPTPVIILEGFTRLTPLQQRFLSTCTRFEGCQVWVVQPYRIEQELGFAALHRTYEPFATQLEVHVLATGPLTDEPALRHVQEGLFSIAAGSQAFPEDASVQIKAFAHRNDEVAAVVDAVIEALEDPETPLSPTEMAVVCSDPIGMVPLLREQAELRKKSELFSIPPRQLLLTPVGRFALTLFEIWKPGSGLELDPDQFATLLAAGWLGGQTQRSVDKFLAVAAQQFTHCRTEKQWHEGFERIRSQQASQHQVGRLLLRLPASQVDLPQLVEWEEALRTVVRLCKRLLHPGERSIGEHISRLLDEIERLDPNRILKAELEILEQIKEALAELTEARSVTVDGHEFGQILSGLIHERETTDDGEVKGSDISRAPHKVWVVGPEGIDNVTRDAVYFIGLDDARLPAPGVPPWPRAQWSAQEHIERQRYRFLAVVRGAKRKLWVSYSRQDWERDYRPSPYLDDVAHLIERESLLARPPAPAPLPVSKPPGRRGGSSLKREVYELDELALFKLCPHRFKLEALSSWGRCYGDSWQLEWLARGVWLAEALAHTAAALPNGGEPDVVSSTLWRAVDDVRGSVEERFAGIARLAWFTIDQDVRSNIGYILQPAGNAQHPLGGIERAPALGHEKEVVTEPHRSVKIRTHADFLQRRGNGRWALRETHQAAIWLLFGKANAPAAEGVDDDLRVFRTLNEAVRWWRDMLFELSQSRPLSAVRRNELVEAIVDIEKARFPKNPGEHCRYCPVMATCMGLKP